MNKATKLAYELRGREVTDAKLKGEFDTIWMSIVNDLAINSEDRELRMDLMMEQILLERFYAHGNLMRDELRHHPLRIPPEHTSLENSVTMDDVRKEHVSLKSFSFKKITRRLVDDSYSELQARQTTVRLAHNILQEISIYI